MRYRWRTNGIQQLLLSDCVTYIVDYQFEIYLDGVLKRVSHSHNVYYVYINECEKTLSLDV